MKQGDCRQSRLRNSSYLLKRVYIYSYIFILFVIVYFIFPQDLSATESFTRYEHRNPKDLQCM